MPEQRTSGADEGSAFPHRAGVPWWVATLIAVAATLTGFAIEAGSGNQELGNVFAACYALGCIAAVLAVRQSGIFTAIVQPPLLLFVAVPLAYFLLHGSAFGGLKDIAISCGYPLIERFPLMLFTSAAVLLIGLVRWYLAMSAPTRPQATAAPALAERPGPFAGLLAGLTARLSTVFAGNGADAEEVDEPRVRRRQGADRSTEAPRPRSVRPPRERAPAGSRHSRPRRDEFADEPPRPRRDAVRRRTQDGDHTMEPPRRRAREARDSREPRRMPPPPRRESRDDREPRSRREPQERRDEYRPRSSRSGGLEPYESGPSGRGYLSRPAYDPYPPQAPRRRPAPGSPETHQPVSHHPDSHHPDSRHPVSRVRYRDSGPDLDHSDGPRNRPRS